MGGGPGRRGALLPEGARSLVAQERTDGGGHHRTRVLRRGLRGRGRRGCREAHPRRPGARTRRGRRGARHAERAAEESLHARPGPHRASEGAGSSRPTPFSSSRGSPRTRRTRPSDRASSERGRGRSWLSAPRSRGCGLSTSTPGPATTAGSTPRARSSTSTATRKVSRGGCRFSSRGLCGDDLVQALDDEIELLGGNAAKPSPQPGRR